MRNLVRHNPNSLGVIEEFDRMFDSMMRPHSSSVSRPAVDIRETEDGYRLEAELPGHTEENVDVKLDDNLLTISANEEKSEEQKKDGYILRERRNRSFCRSFVLPRDVDREHIEAHFDNGVLTLELHKSPEAKPRQIEVKKGK